MLDLILRARTISSHTADYRKYRIPRVYAKQCSKRTVKMSKLPESINKFEHLAQANQTVVVYNMTMKVDSFSAFTLAF